MRSDRIRLPILFRVNNFNINKLACKVSSNLFQENAISKGSLQKAHLQSRFSTKNVRFLLENYLASWFVLARSRFELIRTAIPL